MSHGIPLVGTFRNGWGINEVETGGQVKDQLHQGKKELESFHLNSPAGKMSTQTQPLFAQT